MYMYGTGVREREQICYTHTTYGYTVRDVYTYVICAHVYTYRVSFRGGGGGGICPPLDPKCPWDLKKIH